MVFVLYIIMLIGIARASDMTEHPESLADILTHTHAAGFLDDTHGEEHTDEIGMHTVLQRTPYRDAPAPPCPSHRDVRRPPSPPSQPAHRRPPSLPTPSTPHPPARPANGVRVAGCAEGSRATGRLRGRDAALSSFPP